jgi:hypothetical protein
MAFREVELSREFKGEGVDESKYSWFVVIPKNFEAGRRKKRRFFRDPAILIH